MWSITNRRRRRPRRRHKGAIFMVTSFLWMNPFPFFEKKNCCQSGLTIMSIQWPKPIIIVYRKLFQ